MGGVSKKRTAPKHSLRKSPIFIEQTERNNSMNDLVRKTQNRYLQGEYILMYKTFPMPSKEIDDDTLASIDAEIQTHSPVTPPVLMDIDGNLVFSYWVRKENFGA